MTGTWSNDAGNDAGSRDGHERFGVALVGAGRIGLTHLSALQSSNVAAVTCVVEPREEVRMELARAGVRCFTHLDELIRHLAQRGAVGVQGILIAAPTNRHLGLVRQALSSGFPVLCEKPCGLVPGEAAECVEAAIKAGLLLQVAYWRRYVPELRELRERLLAGELGEILAVHCYQWDEAPPPPQFLQSSGGIFIDMGVHELDQIRWLTGQEISEVQAIVSKSPDGGTDNDCGQLIGKLSGGGTIGVSLGRWHPAGDMCRVEVFGTRKTARLPFLEPANAQSVLENALRMQCEGFARAVTTGELSGATVNDAVAALSLAQEAGALAAGRCS